MSTAASRKRKERFLAERFLEIAKICGSLGGDREAPDFELTVGGRTIGLEVTELFRANTSEGVSFKAQESLSDRIMASARTAYERLGRRPVHVTASFFHPVDLRNVQRDRLADSIADLVARLPLDEKAHTSWRNDYEDSELDSVAFMNVLPVTAASLGHWTVARAAWVAPLTADLIQASIDDKNLRVPAYRAQYPEVWLLIATDSGQPSQMFDFDLPPQLAGVRSDFDKTYVLRMFPGQVFQVPSSDA